MANNDGALDDMIEVSGIRAVTRGAIEAGVEFAAGYPGGPITGIMSGLFAEASSGLHVEWCPNEKDAVAGAFGAALVGRRALAVVKHVGLSVASDAVTAAAFTGIRGALVVATGADPGGRVSQNEMDERSYAELFMLPMLEPSSPADAVRITLRVRALRAHRRAGPAVRIQRVPADLRVDPTAAVRAAIRGCARPCRWISACGRSIRCRNAPSPPSPPASSACGVDQLHEADPFDTGAVRDTILQAVAEDGVSVVLLSAGCPAPCCTDPRR